jgi:hypothetical protein
MLNDDDFLGIVADERRNSIGFDHDDELATQITTALEYAKGEMRDVPSMPNRSKAVSTDVADAIETALPDLVEIFVGGDDVATFQPLGPNDEESAKQETEFVTHTIFETNPGFLLFYSIIKDALLCKIGIAKSWIEEESETEEKSVEVSAEEWPVIAQMAQQEGWEVGEAEQDPETGAVKATMTKTADVVCQKNMAVPPEDFTFARDTVILREATYCAMRSRPRAQTLVDQGYDADQVDNLPGYATSDDAVDNARDTILESDSSPNGATKALRQVEIVEHYIRIDAEGKGKTSLWRVVTGGNETILLEKEKVEMIPFAVITPYINTHRLVGRSLADLLLEIQRIKTALLRMLLDDGYFALNQRLEVATDRSNQFTISDLLRNEPGVPIRSKSGDAVRPVSAGGINFDVMGAIEQINVMAEQRTGIVRNAQGLNPDTLHDTADGARQLIAAAQKRVRMIARVFAETGIKDLFLNVHELLRKHGKQTTAYLGGDWAEIDPSTWPKRKALKVEIGVGSGGREHDIMAGNALAQMLQNAVQAQGGIDGPLTNAKALVAFGKRHTARLGFKNEEQYWTDPEAFAQEQAQKPPVEPPEVQKAKLDAQIKQQTAQQDAQIEAAKMQQQGQQEAERMQMEGQLKREQMEAELALKREQIAAEMELKREQLVAELTLKRELGFAQAAAQREIGHAKVTASTSEVHPGGEPG